MSSCFIATASTSSNFERSNHDPMTPERLSDKIPVLCGSPFETPGFMSNKSPPHHGCPFEIPGFLSESEESPIPRDRPLETLDGFERGEPAPRSEDQTNKEFYKFVRRFTKESKIKFQRSPALISATKSCLKMWFNIDSLTKKQLDYCESFAKQVPYWYKGARNEERLLRAHLCKYSYEVFLVFINFCILNRFTVRSEKERKLQLGVMLLGGRVGHLPT